MSGDGIDDAEALGARWQRAIERQAQAAEEGFDWPRAQDVLAKAVEELQELAEAASPADREEEFGDLLFVLADLARHWKIDADRALGGALAKFDRRFARVMAEAEALPPKGDPARLDAMEARWQAAKRAERAPRGR